MTRLGCYLCKQSKEPSEFYPDKSRPSGYASRCKVCEGGRTRAPKTQYIAAHPERHAAHIKVTNAMQSGKLQKWPACAVPECAKTKVEAHHADYSRPLDVVWLCPAHHKQAHKAHL